MNRISIVVSVLALVLVSLAGAGGESASAADDASAVDGLDIEREYEPTPEELEDLQTFAEQEATTLGHQIAIRGWKTPIVDYLAELSQRLPDEFAGAVVRTGAEREVFIAFKGDVPSEVLAEQRLAGAALELRANVGYSESEKTEQVIAIHHALLKSGQFGEGISSGFDVETGRIEVAIEASAPVSELESSLPAIARSPGVSVRFVESLPNAETGSVYGGGRLEGSSINLLCTAGFKVKKGSTYGMVTAGHCYENLGHRNELGWFLYPVTDKGQHNGTWGDFQWYTTSGTEKDDFYHNYGARRDAASVKTPAAGADVCKFGHAGGKYCDTIYRTNQCQGSTCHLSINHRNDNINGDSGGPVFWGTGIYGVTKGYAYYSPFPWIARATWSPLIYMDEALGGVYAYLNG